MRGRDAVRDLYAATNRLHGDGTPRTHHLVTNVIVEVDPGVDGCEPSRARARSYFVAFQATPALPLQPIVAGRYHDEFHVVDGAWCFADHMVIVDLIGDMSQHLSIDLRTERVDDRTMAVAVRHRTNDGRLRAERRRGEE